jgi:hypothetical protein
MESAPTTETYRLDGREYVYDPDRRSEIKPIPRIVAAMPREGYRVWVEYESGESGEADLEDLLENGLYCGWRNRHYFETLRPDGDSLVWGRGEVDIAPELLYMRITGVGLDEIWPIRFLDVP